MRSIPQIEFVEGSAVVLVESLQEAFIGLFFPVHFEIRDRATGEIRPVAKTNLRKKIQKRKRPHAPARSQSTAPAPSAAGRNPP